jgi:apolipoprotein N-acyltransferase
LPPTIYARLVDIPAAVIVATALLLVIRRRATKHAA